jgi:hypothetical protein
MTSCSSFSGGNACQSADASALAPRVADKVAAQTRRPPFVALAGLEIYLPDSAAVRSTLLLVGGFLAGLIAAFSFVLIRWH